MPHRLKTHQDLPPEANELNFRHLVDRMLTPYTIVTRDLTFVYANKTYLEMVDRKLSDLVGKKVFDEFPSPEAEEAEMRARFEDVFANGSTYTTKHDFDLKFPDGRVSKRIWEAVHMPYYGKDGEVHYLVQHANDITEAEALKKKNEIIAQELDHRIKNMFSVIQAIASLASQRSEDVDEFRKDFSARIVSMSRAYNSLSSGNWEGIDIRSIFEAELDQFGGRFNRQIRIEGPDITFNSRVVQNASMFIHELATNAAKYGALSRPEGRLDISWYAEPDGPGLYVIWDEYGLSGIQPPTRTGFGTQLSNFMPNMKVTRTYRDCGLYIECYLPMALATKQRARQRFVA